MFNFLIFVLTLLLKKKKTSQSSGLFLHDVTFNRNHSNVWSLTKNQIFVLLKEKGGSRGSLAPPRGQLKLPNGPGIVPWSSGSLFTP